MDLRFFLLPLLFIRLVSFWLLIFFFERVVVVLYFFNKLPSRRAIDIVDIFINSLRLDLSMAAYLVAVPFLYIVLNIIFSQKFWNKTILQIYQYFFITIFLLIGFINMNVYREWGTKINYKAILTFIHFPYEVAISGFTYAIVLPAFLYIVLGYFIFKFNNYFNKKIDLDVIKMNVFVKYISSILLLGLNFIFIRGGLQLTPINVSMAQYSTFPVYNHLSTNTAWQLMQNTFFELKPLKSRYVYFSNSTVDKILEEKKGADSSVQIIKSGIRTPNVVLLILESYTSDLIESLGGESGISSNIETLIKDGILFTNIYSSGDRTERGIIAILSSFPSQATRSIIRDYHKQIHLPSISEGLKRKNYHTSFYYGGESEFFGLKSYLLLHRYDQVVDKNMFQRKDYNSKWGAHDEVLLKKHLEDMKLMKEPFFTTILTLSNHEPFEISIQKKYKGNNLPNLFRNTAYYTDLCLGDYFKEARKQPWYTNTLFILVADHGHRLPAEKYEIWDFQRHRIPLIFYGEVLKKEFRGTKNNVVGSQTDIAQTLYNQFRIDVKPSMWSKDLLSFNPGNRYAFFNWDNGFGLVGKDFNLSYNEDAKKIIHFKTTNPSINKEMKLNFAKAYMQKIFSQYMAY